MHRIDKKNSWCLCVLVANFPFWFLLFRASIYPSNTLLSTSKLLKSLKEFGQLIYFTSPPQAFICPCFTRTPPHHANHSIHPHIHASNNKSSFFLSLLCPPGKFSQPNRLFANGGNCDNDGNNGNGCNGCNDCRDAKFCVSTVHDVRYTIYDPRFTEHFFDPPLESFVWHLFYSLFILSLMEQLALHNGPGPVHTASPTSALYGVKCPILKDFVIFWCQKR